MSEILQRLPSFNAQQLAQPTYMALDAQQIAAFKALTKPLHHLLPWQDVQRLLSSHDFPYGFYRLGSQQESWQTFVKILPSSHLAVETHAQAVEHHLMLQGINARQMHITPLAAQGIAITMVYQPLTPCDWSLASAQALGRTLQQVHQGLKTLPQAPQVHQAWWQKRRVFSQLMDEVLAQKIPLCHQLPTQEYQEFLRIWQGYGEMLLQDNPQAQVCHGDLNPGNVMCSGEQMMILDYENSAYAFFPPIWDLGMTIQRILLVSDDWQAMVKAFLQGYGQSPDAQQIQLGMIACNLRSLMILLHRFSLSGHWLAAEWQKFLTLIAQAEQWHNTPQEE